MLSTTSKELEKALIQQGNARSAEWDDPRDAEKSRIRAFLDFEVQMLKSMNEQVIPLF